MGRLKEKLRRFAAKGMVVLLGLLFGCLVAEIGLRIVGYSYPIFYKTDAERGYTPIPYLEGWSWPENKIYVRYNSAGFRDVEHSKAKPANTIRIAVLGDSYAEGRQVDLDSTFWRVIQQKLNRSPALTGKNVEVINFGVNGYGTVEELLTLRQRVWEYSPDVVLLTVTLYNDITDNYRPFKRADELPYFNLDGDRLIYDDSFLQSPEYHWHDSALFGAWMVLHNHSRLVQLLHHAQFAIRTRLQAWKEQRRLAETQRSHDAVKPAQSPQITTASLTDAVGIQNMVYREPDDAYWNEAWQVTEALIRQIDREVTEHGAKFMVATLSSDIQVYPDPAVRQALMKLAVVNDLYYPNRRLQALAERENIPFLDIAEPMQLAADKDRTFFHGFGKEIGNGHWNESGHRFAGELMAQKLEEIISR